MRVCLLTTQVPFIKGGAEFLIDQLNFELNKRKIHSEIVSVPFKTLPNKCLLDLIDFCKTIDMSDSCGKDIDKVIGLKFPIYYAPHRDMVLWMLHQHRAAYDLWDNPIEYMVSLPDGKQTKDYITNLDNTLLGQIKNRYTISQKVSERLKYYNNLTSNVLYPPPPNYEKLFHNEYGDYLFFPSRIGLLKRQELIIRSLAHTKTDLKVVFAGAPDEPKFYAGLLELAKKLNVENKIIWRGFITDEEKNKLYSNARAVVFTPVDEDLGYITMESMLSSKAVLTCTDSGGPTEFVKNEENGLIVEPNELKIAAALDRLWSDKALCSKMGKNALDYYNSLNINWSSVIEKLLG